MIPDSFFSDSFSGDCMKNNRVPNASGRWTWRCNLALLQRFSMPQLRIGTSHSAALMIAVGLGDGRIGGLGNTLSRRVKFF